MSSDSPSTSRCATLAEKLLSRAAGRPVRAGETVVCEVDVAMGTDGSVPMALDYLRQVHGSTDPGAPCRPDRLVFALDHYGSPSGPRAQALQQAARAYAQAHGIRLFEVGEGIGHQLMIDRGLVRPGELAVAADSHAVSYGALNAFGTGIGSSDLAGIMACNQVWLKVPESLRIVLRGALGPGVSAKDVALTLAGRLGADGASYLALEFDGPGVQALDMDDRIVLANMSVEMGAKAGLFPYDQRTRAHLLAAGGAHGTPMQADPGAAYVKTLELDLATVVPQVALPHRVDQVRALGQAAPVPIDLVYLGTCTGGRAKDYREALEVLRAGGGVAAGVRLVVTPASQAVREELERDGLLEEFRSYGADIQPPGCGACCGTCGSVPAGGVRVASTANRNFKGRMGDSSAQIYLASPRSCAQAAVRGTLGGDAG